MKDQRIKRWLLNPLDRASALLFGLFMSLTFTCSVSVATAHRVEIRELVVAALGCNLAWGIVDATMHLVDTLVRRNRNKSILDAIRHSDKKETALRMIAEAVPPVIGSVIGTEGLEDIRKKLVALPEIQSYVRLTARDLRKSAETFLITFLSTFPIVIPFITINDPILALRVSNSVAIVMMFFCGWSVAKYVGLNRWLMSTSMVMLGTILAAVTIALGG